MTDRVPGEDRWIIDKRFLLAKFHNKGSFYELKSSALTLGFGNISETAL
jgi:hypothetical protein